MSERLEKIKKSQWNKICSLFDDNYQLYALWLEPSESIFITNRTVRYNKEHTGFLINMNGHWRNVHYTDIVSFGFGNNYYKNKKK